MTSSTPLTEAYVWIWLPGKSDPVVAGRLYKEGENLAFHYGQSYLGRENRIPIYEPELPLRRGAQFPLPGLRMPSCIRDAAPDSWGRRVIVNRRFGTFRNDIDVDQLDELTYLLESGSDRIGALDFQQSPTTYVPREGDTASLAELLEAAELLHQGATLPSALEHALFHGSAIGGARPKALITEEGIKSIAKFSTSSDVFNVIKGEYIAMRLAQHVGINVASVRLVKAAGRDVLLVERFDRYRVAATWTRRAMVSALTLLELDELQARYASYENLCSIMRHRFDQPVQNLHELYNRLVFNILVSNTDDHARNHAAFWDGTGLTLTPAYDICPQRRAGNEAGQAMFIMGNERMSQLTVCRRASPQFLLTESQADAMIERQIGIIREKWSEVCDEAELAKGERAQMWRRQFLNPYIFEGLPASIAGWQN